MEYSYRTKGDVEFVVPGVGVTVNGVISSHTPIENPNLELIQQPTVEQPAPAHVAGVVPQDAQPAVQPVPQPETPTQTAPAVESNVAL
jgi:hypothetical protein